ncbi:WxL protein host-binding domain-containing protein [Geomicrobium sp. JSM 1781026]|uniref:DUF3324 domain-containing protein n=1 Tax=Geomicrobium sp. JSM 1781026 TaxID=3344580 RepID=UPI0035C14467
MGRKMMACVGMLIGVWLPMTGYANDEDIMFQVQPVVSESQVDTHASYFDMELERGEEETVHMLLVNNGAEQIELVMNYHPATTTSQLEVDYSEAGTNQLENNIEYDEHHLLEPFETKEVPITVTMPDDVQEGIILGGMYVEMDQDDEASGLINAYAYIIGMQLMNDRDEAEALRPNLNLQSVRTDLVYGEPGLVAELANDVAVAATPLHVQTTIYRDGELFLEDERQAGSMAPSSVADFFIAWPDRQVAPGNYEVDLTISDEEETWQWTDSFHVEADEADDLNEASIISSDNSTMLWLIMGGAMIALLVGVAYYAGKRGSAKRSA